MHRKIAIIIDYAVRLSAITLLFIIDPIVAILINMFFDTIDYAIYRYILKIKIKDTEYQINDKVLDYVYYVGLMIAALYWQLPYAWLFGILFLYRSIGQILFFLKKNREIFAYFPNFFEYSVLGFLVARQIKAAFLLDITLPLIVLAISFAMWHEIFLHSQKKSMTKIFLIPLLKKLSILSNEEAESNA